MTRRRGNPNWCRPIATSTLTVSPPTFEAVARALGLAPKDFESSIPLKEWVSQNLNHKYVPLDLLEAWNMEPDLGR